MVTMAQRIEELRTEQNLSRAEFAAKLGFPKNAPEKFETGRATPTREQQEKMADFFGVSLFYLKGESSDRTRMDAWLESGFTDDTDAHVPMQAVPKKPKPTPAASASTAGQGTLFDSFLQSKQFCELVESTILDVLRSPEGEELIAKVVRKELLKQR